MFLCVSGVAAARDGPDYLAPALRAEVETLKRTVELEPTNANTIVERARVLADWIDAVALTGDPDLLTVTGPHVRSYIRAARWGTHHSIPNQYAGDPPDAATLARRSAEIDTLVRYYRLRDEEPEALGTLEADDLGPFEAGGLATIRQTWTAGSRGMRAGGRIRVDRHFASGFGPYQTEDPAGEGYVWAAADDSDAVFAAQWVDGALGFVLVDGFLDPGATVTITYGDAGGGSPGLRVGTVSGENIPLRLRVDVDGSGLALPLPSQPFVIEGSGVAGVHGFAPSVVAPGERFELSVRAEDHHYNRATGPIPAFDVFVDDELRATTTAGSPAIQPVALTIEEPGPHWIALRSKDGLIDGIANPVLVEEQPARRIFWGDTHGHSGYAEGIGTVDHFMRFARDDARLDFVTHSEHDTALDDGEWRLMRATTAEYDDPGVFIPYLGYEWSMRATNGGHHNVLFRNIAGRERVSALEYPTLSLLYQALRERYPAREVLTIPHAHQAGDARHSDPLLEPLIEILSMHGTFEWFARSYLSRGHQVGFVAASDDHSSHPGYSAPRARGLAQRGGLGAVFAAERSRDALFDAMRARRTYATTGDRIILETSLNGVGMGQRAPYAEERRIEGRVIGTAAIDTVTVFRNDEPVWSRDYLTDTSDGAPNGPALLELSFQSDATPGHWGDTPRGWRTWRGTLTLDGGRIVAARGLDFDNRFVHVLEDDGETWRFATLTRGDISRIALEVDALQPGATLIIDLEETIEQGSGPPTWRRPATIPGSVVRLPLHDMRQGRLSAPASIPGYADSIALRRIARGGEQHAEFTFTDDSEPRHGDYYYVRVRQANDAAAWSSPVWVGGYAHR